MRKTMGKDVVLRIPKHERAFADLLEETPSLAVTNLAGSGMDGGGEYLVLLIPLAHLTIKTLVDLLKAHWERAKNVKLEVDGMTVTGASLDEISAFLERQLHQGDDKT